MSPLRKRSRKTGVIWGCLSVIHSDIPLIIFSDSLRDLLFHSLFTDSHPSAVSLSSRLSLILLLTAPQSHSSSLDLPRSSLVLTSWFTSPLSRCRFNLVQHSLLLSAISRAPPAGGAVVLHRTRPSLYWTVTLTERECSLPIL